jgi:glycerol uptake facilitator-like aquaporin
MLIDDATQQGMFIEMFCTAALVISVLMLAAESA